MAYTKQEIRKGIELARSKGDYEAASELALMLEEQQTETAVNNLSDTDAVETAREEAGSTEAFFRGFGQDVTMGFQDELAGVADVGLEALKGNIPWSMEGVHKTYVSGRDEARRRNKEAEKNNPGAYQMGEMAGMGASIATGLLTGGVATAATQGIKQAAKAGAKVGAKSGALYGLGTSEADTTGGLIVDTAQGAGIGSLSGGAFAGATGAFQKGARYVGSRANKYALKAIDSKSLNRLATETEMKTGAMSSDVNDAIKTIEKVGGIKDAKKSYYNIDPIRKKVGAELGDLRKQYQPALSQVDQIDQASLINRLAAENQPKGQKYKANKRYILDAVDELGLGAEVNGNKLYNTSDVQALYRHMDDTHQLYSSAKATLDPKASAAKERLFNMSKRARTLESENVKKAVDSGFLPKDAALAIQSKSKEYGKIANIQKYAGESSGRSLAREIRPTGDFSSLGEMSNPMTAAMLHITRGVARNVQYPLARAVRDENPIYNALKGANLYGNLALSEGIKRGLTEETGKE